MTTLRFEQNFNRFSHRSYQRTCGNNQSRWDATSIRREGLRRRRRGRNEGRILASKKSMRETRIHRVSGTCTPGIESGLALGIQASGGMIKAGGMTMVGLRGIGVNGTGHGVTIARLQRVPLKARQHRQIQRESKSFLRNLLGHRKRSRRCVKSAVIRIYLR